MDINDQLKTIADTLIKELRVNLEKEVQDKVTEEIVTRVATLELDNIVNQSVTAELKTKLGNFNFYELSTKELSRVIAATTDHINKQLIEAAKNQIVIEITDSISKINVHDTVSDTVKTHLSALLNSISFPDASISHKSINFTGFKVTGDIIKGGIIENFGSTGIEDRSTFVQLTLLDHASVFEGPVHTPELHVKGTSTFAETAIIRGNLIVEGDLLLAGSIPETAPIFASIIKHSAEHTQELLKESLNDEWFSNYSKIIFDEIKANGLDLDHITQNTKDIVKGNQLGYHIIDTNIQRVGHLRDLQTRGETLLSDTFYVTAKRAGVNTLDPSAAFVVWDEECEIIVAKRKQDIGFIGTSRNQSVILGSNNKDNITLNTDGSTAIQNLVVGAVNIGSSASIPSHAAPKGTVMFNEHPDIGLPVGWVSLGGARWANFGMIE